MNWSNLKMTRNLYFAIMISLCVTDHTCHAFSHIGIVNKCSSFRTSGFKYASKEVKHTMHRDKRPAISSAAMRLKYPAKIGQQIPDHWKVTTLNIAAHSEFWIPSFFFYGGSTLRKTTWQYAVATINTSRNIQ